ncbi:hypothetical protein MalM25_04100 [Planctomycetes bacterium MalM25]|nr:hypothetical protein MalM25_04100 [Planctomycetes bacterium MalM25]
MKSLCIALATCCSLALFQGTASALDIYVDNFDSYDAGSDIGGPNWQPKWAADSTQQALFKAAAGGEGYGVIDTTVAERQYRVNGKSGFSLLAGDTVNVAADFRYHLEAGGDAPAVFNSNVIGLQLSDSENWWAGSRKSVSLANRGPAMGNRLPVAPWVQNWIPHTSLGIADPALGGISEWININLELMVSDGTALTTAGDMIPAGNIYGSATFTPESLAGEPVENLPVTDVLDLGYTAGTMLYAGFTTDWTSVAEGEPTTVSSYASVSEVNIDNFSLVSDAEAPAGDYNQDGYVDAADYTIWRDSNGQVGGGLAADGTGDDLLGVPDGDVDSFDYDFWDANYGSSAFSAPPVATAVPEPGTLALVGFAALVAFRRR